MKADHIFWTDANVPFVEMRFTRRSAESYKAHSHQEFCVGIVTEGVTLATIREKTYALSPGSLVLIPPELVHSCNPLEGRARSYCPIGTLAGGSAHQGAVQCLPDNGVRIAVGIHCLPLAYT